MNTKLLPIVMLATALSACGFHLRSAFSFDQTPLAGFTVETPPERYALDRHLRLALLGIERGTAKADPIIVRITGTNQSSRASAIDSRGKVAEYELTYELHWLLMQNNKPASVPQVTRTQRSYNYDATAVMGKGTEATLIYKQLEQQACAQLIDQLRVLQPDATIATTAP